MHILKNQRKTIKRSKNFIRIHRKGKQLVKIFSTPTIMVFTPNLETIKRPAQTEPCPSLLVPHPAGLLSSDAPLL